MDFRFDKLFTLAVLSLAIPIASAAGPTKYASDRIIVKFKAGYQATAPVTVKKLGMVIRKRMPELEILTVEVPKGLNAVQTVAMYKSRADVQYAELCYLREMDIVPNDAEYGKQYAPKLLDMETAWNTSTGRSDVIIAVIDSGVSTSHPEFAGRLLPGYDFSDNDNDPNDADGHGTHCAGIAAAKGNNLVGVAGMTWNTKILPVKIFPNAFTDVVIDAIKYSADQGANVITMSFGGAPESQAEQDVVNYAWSKNCLLFGSAGNDGVDFKRYPGNYNHVLTVGSSDNRDERSGFSNFGDWVEITAPGSDIYSTFPGGYAFESGTSMSCPMSAGLGALLFSVAPKGYSNQKIADAITSTAKNVGTWLKYGRINPVAALKKIPKPIGAKAIVTDVSRYVGQSSSGSVSSVKLDDSASFDTNSVTVARLGAVAASSVTFKISRITNLDTANLILKSRAQTGVTQFVYIQNPVTKVYESLQANPLATADSKLSITIDKVSRYVSSTGTVTVLVRGLMPIRLMRGAAGYQHRLNLAELQLAYLN
jgi:thermitase